MQRCMINQGKIREWQTRILILLSLLCLAAATAEDNFSAVRYRYTMADNVAVVVLNNGLTVIIKPVHTAPVVCVRSFVRAGSIYEREYLGSGISHLLEHLVAKGAVHEMPDGITAESARETSAAVEAIGGQSNAYTTLDHASYYISAAAGKTEECIKLVADWMARPAFTEDDFKRELGVVQRELEMGLDDPGRQLYQAHAANTYRSSAAGVPVIGYKAALQKLTYEDVKKYHARLYVPQNMIFAVVGDVEVEEVLHLVQESFAGFAPGREPELDLPQVHPLKSVRRVQMSNRNAGEVLQRMSFQTIDLFDADLYALDLLSYVLSQGEASRLVRNVQREKQLVTSVHSSSWTPAWGRGIFSISFRATPENADAAEEAVLEELRQIMAAGITEAELARAKRQKRADYVYSQQNVDAQAGTLGSDWLATGDVTFSKQYTDRIQQVTAAQVQAVARYYCNFTQMAVTRVSPAVEPDLDETVTTVQEERQEALELELDNGLRCLLQPDPGRGLVSMAFVSLGGVLLEDQQTNGIGTTMTALSTRGAGERSATEIAAFFDRAGGRLTGDCGNNSFYWQATVLADSHEEALGIFADVIVRPAFEADELTRLKPLLIAGIDRVDERWQSQLQHVFRQNFFARSPYRFLPSGQVHVVENLSVEELRAYHHHTVRASSSVLCIFGDFDLANTEALVRAHFSNLPSGEVLLPVPTEEVARPVTAASGEQFITATDKEVAAVIVAAPGMKITNVADTLAINVLDAIISGYRLPSGWLHRELRGRQLVYVVHAYNWAGVLPGAFVTYAAGQPADAAEIVNIIRKNLERASSYEPEMQEVEQAVNSILTAEILQNQSLENLALGAALNELYGLGYDFQDDLEARYRDISPADVLRVGAKYLQPPYSVTILTPKPEILGEEFE